MTLRALTKKAREIYGNEPGHVTNSKGVVTIREGFFYRLGRSCETLAARIREELPEAKVIDMGETDLPFHGGKGVRQNSHFWVQITVKTT